MKTKFYVDLVLAIWGGMACISLLLPVYRDMFSPFWLTVIFLGNLWGTQSCGRRAWREYKAWKQWEKEQQG